jgi:hypothetical protein
MGIAGTWLLMEVRAVLAVEPLVCTV